MMHHLPDNWRKSSYSGDTNGQCLEYQVIEAKDVAVRDSKRPEQGAFRFSASAWQSFVTAVRTGGISA
ncbi:DUF397 domain-containing protein [Streptomyces sp. NPDC057654]|uniref:DUF397 domain-containing protein n=1 Tax=Streptomyces sp. NPDC057654 TaxID=3346196 RepID=UPI003686DBDE